MTFCKFLLLVLKFPLIFGKYETPDMPFLPFKMESQNTAISGPSPWLIQEFTSKHKCFKTCLQNFTLCGHVQYKEISANRWFCQLYDVIENLFDYLVSQIGETLYSAQHQDLDCSDWKDRGYTIPGTYWIFRNRTKMRTVCNTGNPPWTLIQKRTSAYDFNRSWEEYKNGFGDPETNFWIGNDKIHKLTYGREMQIRFTGEPYSKPKKFCIYTGFYIEGEENKYRLHTGAHTGGSDTYAGDWALHNGSLFSVRSQDNDGWANHNCAVRFKLNGWWLGIVEDGTPYCAELAFNGDWDGQSPDTGPFWKSLDGYKSLKATTMEIRFKEL
eukprot:TCONS_00057358-protein